MPSLKTLTPTARFEPILQASVPFQALLALCRQRNVPVYLVGGAVRDLLYRGTLSKDLDVVVPASAAREIAETLARNLDGKCICLDEQYQIYRVILFPDLDMLDIAGCIGEDIHADLLRRDFSINAMAYAFETQTLLDPTGGLADLERGRLRMVSEFNLLDDPLRMLRLFRLGAELDMTDVDPATLAVVAEHGDQLFRAAIERIQYELMKLFSAPTCFTQVRWMAETGVLEMLFPELAATHQCPPNLYHHLGLFDHTLELLRQAEIHFPDLPEGVREYLFTNINPFIKRVALVRLACLCHDLGKPVTMAYEPETGRYRFYGHEEVSEEITQGMAIRFKWGKDMTRQVAHLVRWHLYPGDMLKPGVSDKAFRRFFGRVGDLLPEMVLLALADRFSAQGPAVTPADLMAGKVGLLNLLERYQALKASENAKPKLLTGRDVMEHLGIPSGPEVGNVLNAVTEAYLNGDVSTREDALAWLCERYRPSRP